MEYSVQRLQEILSGFKGKKIAVVGDIMLDRYHWGNHAKMSPEAPVPVVDIESSTESMGGAANVLNNLYFLGAQPIMIGVVGDDDAGASIIKKIKTENLSHDGIFVDSARSTTIKERVISDGRHVVRIDWENKKPIGSDLQRKIIDYLNTIIRDVDAIIIQDYNKGVISENLVNKIIAKCIANDKILSVDPKKENFFSFKKTTVFKPNVAETVEALRMPINNQSDVRKAGRELLDRLHCQAVLITQGREGMTLFQKNGDIQHIETKVREVADVSGAGDTVIATYTMALSAGANFVESAVLANISAGLVCEDVGVVPVETRKIKSYLDQETTDNG